MARPKVNFVVDCCGFVGFVLLAATGVLMRYVLPPGSGRHTTIWTLDRHEWGTIHFWLAIILLSVLALHLFLHWRWIVTFVRGRPREGSGARVALGTVGLIALLALALSPFLSPVERAGGELRTPRPHSSAREHSESIRGFMTLDKIQEVTGVPADTIIEKLGLPPGVPKDERLGRLKVIHGFTMEDVRRIVEAHEESGGR